MFLISFSKFPGKFLEISGKCPGNFRDISRTFPGNFRKFPGNFREISGNFPGNFRGKFRENSFGKSLIKIGILCTPPYKFPPVMRIPMPNPMGSGDRSRAAQPSASTTAAAWLGAPSAIELGQPPADHWVATGPTVRFLIR